MLPQVHEGREGAQATTELPLPNDARGRMPNTESAAHEGCDPPTGHPSGNAKQAAHLYGSAAKRAAQCHEFRSEEMVFKIAKPDKMTKAMSLPKRTTASD